MFRKLKWSLLLQRTTWAGIGSVVAGIVATVSGDLNSGLAGISAGIGLIFAEDL